MGIDGKVVASRQRNGRVPNITPKFFMTHNALSMSTIDSMTEPILQHPIIDV